MPRTRLVVCALAVGAKGRQRQQRRSRIKSRLVFMAVCPFCRSVFLIITDCVAKCKCKVMFFWQKEAERD